MQKMKNELPWFLFGESDAEGFQHPLATRLLEVAMASVSWRVF